MTPDQIKEKAREIIDTICGDFEIGQYSKLWFNYITFKKQLNNAIVQALTQAIEEEREACERIAKLYSPSDNHYVGDKIATAIRSRGIK